MGYSEERRPIGGPDGTPTGHIPPVDMGSRPAIFLAGQAEGAAVRPALLQRRCDEQNLRLRGRYLVCPSTAEYGNRRARPTLPAADRERMSENAIIDPMKTAVYYYGDNPERSCHRRERD